MENSNRLAADLARLRNCMRLLGESIESYERNGSRTLDKLTNDLRMVALACWDVAVRLGVG